MSPVLVAILAAGVGLTARASMQTRPAAPAIAARELATTVTDGFTIAAVGDTILGLSPERERRSGFQSVLALIRSADVATANYEGNIIDGRTFRGTGPGGFAGTPEVAADLKAMGFDLVARSNNHAGEYGYEGLLETNGWLDKAGVVYAGSGEKYASARAARFVSTPKGPRRHGGHRVELRRRHGGRGRPGRMAGPRRAERPALHPVLHEPVGPVAGGDEHPRGLSQRHRLLRAHDRHRRHRHDPGRAVQARARRPRRRTTRTR